MSSRRPAGLTLELVTKEAEMGNPVVHFEILGKDGKTLQEYYSQLFDWKVDANNPMNYGMVSREDNLSPEGVGIGGGIAGYGEDESHVTVYVGVEDVEATLKQAEELGGTRVMGPDTLEEARIELGQFKDPEGHLIGVIRPLM
jgi:predicted enzyme related to lactoylglutathione lyase